MLFATLQVYVFNNKYSLAMNLGDCDFPSTLEDIQITNRFELISFFTDREGYSKANCKIDKRNLKAWLLNADFEVLSYIDSTTNERQFVVDKEKIPTKILEGKHEFSFQFKRENDQRTVIVFRKYQDKNKLKVRLRYCES